MGWTVNVSDIVMYVAQCAECSWTGEVRADRSYAEKDAQAHRLMHQREWEKEVANWEKENPDE